MKALRAEELAKALEEGALLIDVNAPLDFAHEHIAGSINLEFNAADLADRTEMVLPPGTSVIVCAGSDSLARSAAEILLGAGFGAPGYLSGGLNAWARAGNASASFPVISAEELHASDGEFQVIDAREGYEFRHGHISGARLLPSTEAWERVEEIPVAGTYAVVCGVQTRSALVSSILRRSGRDALLVRGGMTDWLEKGYPVERSN